jgi:fatty-acid desaturase
VWLILPVSFGLPVFLSVYFFDEDFKTALYGNLFRYMLTLHFTWCTNSFSHHVGGTKPFEK